MLFRTHSLVFRRLASITMREVGQSGESFSALNEPYGLQCRVLISTSKPLRFPFGSCQAYSRDIIRLFNVIHEGENGCPPDKDALLSSQIDIQED